MRQYLLFLLLPLLTACGGPWLILPGGALDGTVTPPPEDWSAAESVSTIQVEFRPSDPYSHNIWGVGVGRDLYIATGDGGTRWTPMVTSDPHMRARIGTALYELRAVPVTDAAERARVTAVYVRKYDLDAADNWLLDGLIFRLDRR